MPESLFNRRKESDATGAGEGFAGFRLAGQAIRALKRLKDAGFMIIGLGSANLFQGFATPDSCQEFLRESSLDDLIIPAVPATNEADGCSPALIQAAAKWLLDLDRSFIIGREGTISSADLTGCTPLQIQKRAGEVCRTSHCVPSISAAAERILQLATSEARPASRA